MARPPAISPQDKAKLVLMVLSRELSVTEAAREAGVSGQAVSNWRRQFIESGLQGLEGADRKNSERERQLRAQILELKKALGEAYIQLRAQRLHDRALAAPGPSRHLVSATNPSLRNHAGSAHRVVVDVDQASFNHGIAM